MCHYVGHRKTVVHAAAVCFAVPPGHQLFTACSWVFLFPVELRHHVIYPTFLGPLGAVGVKCVVAFQTVGFATASVGFLVAPDAEWADTKLHPRLHLLQGVVKLFDEQVHIVAAPVAFVGPTFSLSVFLPRCAVGKFYACHWVRVEVVVHVNGIHIVAVDDVAHHHVDEVATFGQSRVEVNLAVGIFHKPLRVLIVNVSLCRFVVLSAGHAVWVNPSVQFHAALVGFVDHKLQWVPHWGWRHAGSAANPFAPRFELAGIGCVGLWADLPDNGVHAVGFKFVELPNEVLSGLFRSHFCVLALTDDVEPCASELMFLCILCHAANCRQGNQHGC